MGYHKKSSFSRKEEQEFQEAKHESRGRLVLQPSNACGVLPSAVRSWMERTKRGLVMLRQRCWPDQERSVTRETTLLLLGIKCWWELVSTQVLLWLGVKKTEVLSVQQRRVCTGKAWSFHNSVLEGGWLVFQERCREHLNEVHASYQGGWAVCRFCVTLACATCQCRQKDLTGSLQGEGEVSLTRLRTFRYGLILLITVSFLIVKTPWACSSILEDSIS